VPTSWVEITILLLAIVPGYIAVSVWARNRTWRGHSSSAIRVVLQSLAVSLVIQIAVSPLTVQWILPAGADHQDSQPWTVAGWLAVTVLVVPTVGGVLVARVTDWILARPLSDESNSLRRWLVTELLQMSVPPTIWDWAITNGKVDGSFLRIEYSDGGSIGGIFATDSYVATSPDTHGIFLQEEWLLTADGDFVDAIPGSQGIIIPNLDGVRAIRILGEVPQNEITTEVDNGNHDPQQISGDEESPPD
jgi:hypothetical protein